MQETDSRIQAQKKMVFPFLMNRRLLFVMGKGGVGKTTMTAALGEAGVISGKNVLVAEVGNTNALAEVYGYDKFPSKPVEISPNFWAAHVNPRQELTEYIHTHVGIKFVAKKITNAKLFTILNEAAPGLKEMMTLGQIWRWTEEKQDAAPRFDLIVVDAPATGHGIALLRQPGTLINMLQFGPVTRQIEILDALLKDENQTGIVIVSLPEELSVNECTQLIDKAEKELSMKVDMLVLNAMYRERFSGKDAERIETMDRELPGLSFSDENEEKKTKALLDAAYRQLHRRRIQVGYENRLRNYAPEIPHMEIPFFFVNHLEIHHIRKIASFFAGADSVQG